MGSKRWNVNKSIRARSWELQLPLRTIKRLFMLPWRAIPVTLAHWREPQIISSPSLCLLLAFFLVCPWSFLLCYFFPSSFSQFYVFLPRSPTRSTHGQTRATAILFCSISLFLTFLSLPILFITIPSCFLLSLGSVFIFPLVLAPFSGACRTFQRPPKKKTRKERLLDCVYYKISNVVSYWELSTGRKKNLSTRHVGFRRLHCEDCRKKNLKKNQPKISKIVLLHLVVLPSIRTLASFALSAIVACLCDAFCFFPALDFAVEAVFWWK